jgi:hypothetical protein
MPRNKIAQNVLKDRFMMLLLTVEPACASYFVGLGARNGEQHGFADG